MSQFGNRPLVQKPLDLQPRRENSETEEIMITDWLDTYESDDASNILPQMQNNLQNI